MKTLFPLETQQNTRCQPDEPEGHKVVKAVRKEKQIPLHGTRALAANFAVTQSEDSKARPHAAERKELSTPNC